MTEHVIELAPAEETSSNPQERDILLKHRQDIRKQAELMVSKSGADIAAMTPKAVQALVFEFQVHQIELELQNEELVNAHLELGKSHERYAKLYNLSPIAFLTLNEEGVIQEANLAAGRLLGCSKENLINKKFGKYIYPADQDDYHFFIHSFAGDNHSKPFNIRLNIPENIDAGILTRASARNNRVIYTESQCISSYKDKNELQLSMAIFDVTERRQAQEDILRLNEKLEEKLEIKTEELIESNRNLMSRVEELKQSRRQLREREAKLNAIFNAAMEGIITIDGVGIIVSVNHAVSTIFGYNQEELLGCDVHKLLPLSKADYYRVKNNLQRKISKVVGKMQEVDGVRKDGSHVPLELSIAEFLMDGNRYYTSLVRDVSERKRQEKEHREHLDALAHVTRLGLMAEMASGIAHEVNQPLTAIASYTHACLHLVKTDKIDVTKLSEILHKTHQQALRAGQIIHRMRDFVKPKQIHRTTIDINSLINVCLSMCTSDLTYHSIKPIVELSDALPSVYVDNVQIEQVILNLLRNGMDALKNVQPPKQRKIFINTYLNDNNFIEVKIKDNGAGISESLQKKITTPFYTTKSEGMGMGLTISHSIIKDHEGSLYFNSKLGKGTTFYFTLPARRESNGLLQSDFFSLLSG
jgi:PAS domain S-box-containing protein